MTNELHQLAGPYALDAIDDDERQQFEAHLEACPSCRGEVAEFAATVVDLAGAAAVAPPSGLRDRVLAEVATTRQVSPIVPERVVDLAERRRRRAPSPRLLAVAAAAIVFVVGLVGVSRLGDGELDDVDSLLAAPDVIVTDLEGETGQLQIAWSAELDQAALIGDGLEDLDSEHAYELWFILPEGMAAAGLFTPENGEIREVLELADHDTTGWGVTVELAEGADQPTSEPVFVATF